MATIRTNENGLNDQQQRFADLYLADPTRNGKQAAIGAGYSVRSAEVTASKLLRHPKVSAYIESRQQKLMKKFEVTQERIIQELACIGFMDVADVFDEEGNLLPVHRMPEHARRAIAGIEVVEMAGGAAIDAEANVQHVAMHTKKIKITDKKGALELLGKHHKMFTDRVEHTGKDGADLIPKTDMREMAKEIAFALAKGLKDER